MLEKILAVETMEEFAEVSGMLTSADSWRELQKECCNKSIVLYQSDMWTEDVVKRLLSKPDFISEVLEAIASDDINTKLVHILQVIGQCNPGLRRSVENYIKRAAL